MLQCKGQSPYSPSNTNMSNMPVSFGDNANYKVGCSQKVVYSGKKTNTYINILRHVSSQKKVKNVYREYFFNKCGGLLGYLCPNV